MLRIKKSSALLPTLSILLTLVCCTNYPSEAPMLFYAIIEGDLQEAQAALQAGENPNAIHQSDDAQRGQTPLIMAVLNGQDDLVDLLLRQPTIDVNAHSTYDGTTALIEAAKLRNGRLVTRLFNAGADLDAVDHEGRSARSYNIEN